MALIDNLIERGYLKTPGIISAFRKIKRGDFIVSGGIEAAELNSPLSIGYGQTISQPLTVAFMLEQLSPGPGDKVLDVGSGSGWTAALLSEIVGERGKVYGIERIGELKKFAEKNIGKYDFINRGIASMREGDGYKGLPEFAPFDKIIVAAAAPEIPKKLLEQLSIGGRLVIPIGPELSSQEIIIIDRTGKDEYKEKRFPGFIFVPLVKE